MFANKEHALSNKRIGIMGKGGSGKSTLTALLAKSLKKSGYEVCVLDGDPTNVGLAQALGIERPPSHLLDYFGDMVFSDGSFIYPTGDLTPLGEADFLVGDLPEAYHGRSPDGIHFFIAGKVADIGIDADFIGPIAKITHEFKPRHSIKAPVTLVDFKAGLEDAVSGDIMSLDWIVVVIDPTMAAVQMAVHMREIVNQLKAGEMPYATYSEKFDLRKLEYQLFQGVNVPGVVFVLNKVQDELTEQFLRDKLAEKGITPLGTIQDALALSMAGLMGEPLIKSPAHLEADWIIKALETAVTHSPISSPLEHPVKDANHPQNLVDQHSLSYMNLA